MESESVKCNCLTFAEFTHSLQNPLTFHLREKIQSLVAQSTAKLVCRQNLRISARNQQKFLVHGIRIHFGTSLKNCLWFPVT